MERHGALGDGGKWICGLSRLAEKPDCIVYSFGAFFLVLCTVNYNPFLVFLGINHESSFEAEVLSNTRHCQIWGYDFSVNSFGPEISNSLRHRAHFHAYGLSGQDKHGPDDNPPMYTLESLMKMNGNFCPNHFRIDKPQLWQILQFTGHTHIDLLKIDIEGWEFETMTDFLKPYVDSGKPLPFGQLSMEIHLWDKSFESFLGWWEMLEAAGLRPFATEPNLVYLNYNKKKGTPDLAEVRPVLLIQGNVGKLILNLTRSTLSLMSKMIMSLSRTRHPPNVNPFEFCYL